MIADDFLTRGYAHFPSEGRLETWIKTVRPTALATAHDPRYAHWHRHRRTWFAGVNVLENDNAGAISGTGPLHCAALDIAQTLYGTIPLDPAQVSIVYPGYPLQDARESDAAHNFRQKRDAAHLDGLMATGPQRRRYLNEPHAWILGLPLGDSHQSPLVVWEGSHHVMRSALTAAFEGLDADKWGGLDVTGIYQTARRQVFDTCLRIELPVRAGEATLVHRLAIHGVAPWGAGGADLSPRAILYFRPALPGGAADWLSLP